MSARDAVQTATYQAFAVDLSPSQWLETLQQEQIALDSAFYASLLSIFFTSSLCPSIFCSYLEEALKHRKASHVPLQAFLELFQQHVFRGRATINPDVLNRLGAIYLRQVSLPNMVLASITPTMAVEVLSGALQRDDLPTCVDLARAILNLLPPSNLSVEDMETSRAIRDITGRQGRDSEEQSEINAELQRFEGGTSLANAITQEYDDPEAKQQINIKFVNPLIDLEPLTETTLLPEVMFAVVQMVTDRVLDDAYCARLLHSCLSVRVRESRTWRAVQDRYWLTSVSYSALYAAVLRFCAQGEDNKERFMWQSFMFERVPSILRAFLANHSEIRRQTDSSLAVFDEAWLACQKKCQSGDNGLSAITDLSSMLPQAIFSASAVPPSSAEEFAIARDPLAFDLANVFSCITLLKQRNSLHKTIVNNIHKDFIARCQTSPSMIQSACKAICADKAWVEVLSIYTDFSFASNLSAACDQFDPVAEHAVGDGSAFEQFGQLISALLVLYFRYSAQTRKALSATAGFSYDWLNNLSRIQSLDTLAQDERILVGNWIRALLNEGISDELLGGTRPQQVLRLAPVIVSQCIAARAAEKVNLETLKDACSYLTQDMLRFTIPSVVMSLVGEIKLKGSTRPAWTNAAIEVLDTLLTGPSTPPEALEITLSSVASLQPANTLTPSLLNVIAAQPRSNPPTNLLQSIIGPLSSLPKHLPTSTLASHPKEAVQELLPLPIQLVTMGQELEMVLSRYTIIKMLLACESTTFPNYPILLALLKKPIPIIQQEMEVYTDLVGAALVGVKVKADTPEKEEEVRQLIKVWKQKCLKVTEETRLIMRAIWEPYKHIR